MEMTMEVFAKLYETKKHEQILVTKDEDEETGGPIIKITSYIGDDVDCMGVCSTALKFDDSEDGWDKRDGAFCKIDEEIASSIVENMKRDVSDIFGEQQ